MLAMPELARGSSDLLPPALATKGGNTSLRAVRGRSGLEEHSSEKLSDLGFLPALEFLCPVIPRGQD